MKTYNIAVIPGDGTGPEVIGEGLKVLKAAAKKFKFGLKTKVFPFGGKHYLETGRLVDEADEEEDGTIRVKGKKFYPNDDRGAAWHDVWITPNGKIVREGKITLRGSDL